MGVLTINISINGSSFCSGQPVAVSHTLSTSPGRFHNNNYFTEQLSRASGSFTSPVNIGTLTSKQSVVINAVRYAESLGATGCSSAARTPVTATVYTAPAAPVAAA